MNELLRGICASKGRVEGKIKIVSLDNINLLNSLDNLNFILVCEKTDPSYLLLMMKSKGVITQTGGVVSHAAIVSRELGIPCIVGCEGVLGKLKDEQQILLDATNGVVYG